MTRGRERPAGRATPASGGTSGAPKPEAPAPDPGIRINGWMTFEDAGDMVEGELVGRQRVVRAGKEGSYEATVYHVYDKTAHVVVGFNGTYQINQILGALRLGQRVRIEYERRVKVPSGFSVKVFDIRLMNVTPADLIRALSAPAERPALIEGVVGAVGGRHVDLGTGEVLDDDEEDSDEAADDDDTPF